MKKRNSLVFKSTIVLSVLFFLLESIVTMMNQSQMKSQIFTELSNMGWTLSNIIVEDIPHIEKAKTLLGSDALMKDEQVQQVQKQLDSMKNNEMIANSYIYMPDMEESGDSTKLKLVLANQELYDSGLKPGSIYEAKGAFRDALNEMKKIGYATSKVYSDDYGQWVSIVNTVKDSSGKVTAVFGIDYNYSMITDRQSAVTIRTSIIGSIVALAFILLTIFMVRFTLRSITQLSKLSIKAAEGDLSVEAPVKGKDEVGILSANFNTMIANIRHLIENVQQTSDKVTQSSKALAASADQTSRATEEITRSIQEVAQGSETQMQSAVESQVAMEEMTVGIQRIAEYSSRLSEHAQEVAKNAEAGNHVVRQSVEEMESIHSTVSDTVGILEELENRSQEIEKIVAIISNIAGQTNLLALNASIEAARVGEHGRGFAVVAQEVRKLAELSGESSEQISSMLNEIASYVNRASTAMNASMHQVAQGSESVQKAGAAFGEIVVSLQNVNEQVHEVSASAEQMSAGSEQIAASLDELARIGRNASGHSQSVAASSEEQMASMQEISGSATMLQSMADDLEKEVRVFKLKA
ncbi:HAMP domain-containing methyl-accepting chemotaxis protein [Paenibacillus dokdonensis]|uniref:HAMP domain-containing methyl-accepting chemotaxis protein n=1 Tax=Paenibacillus dokdonensis TaxID=2567944 RepID=A0ABU6GVB3_9BACL|nr:HAMP domain-containing methyl-accepting chemotaxis protein [Paenibacillus dokdonensis]MEC0243694.1 HAMP domain-containing methyl-accepting chemotaxis protein [Paenibacillus dokdonensis]